ncbi:hypothetical protein SAMN04488548_1344148 [Gordonia westfalica]|uniref:Uncharacterized protein n=1 Tax=Gordonia westfalica TaxID=158898 RepID=A0A1H2L0N7_9ACTN|nr:hypothetical protein SAMN04488548_1344148 [Gordonia westfalica]
MEANPHRPVVITSRWSPGGDHFSERLRLSSSCTLIWDSSPDSSERACRSARGRRRRESESPDLGSGAGAPVPGRGVAAGVASGLSPRSIGDGPGVRRPRVVGVEFSGDTEAASGRRPASSRLGRRPSGDREPVSRGGAGAGGGVWTGGAGGVWTGGAGGGGVVTGGRSPFTRGASPRRMPPSPRVHPPVSGRSLLGRPGRRYGAAGRRSGPGASVGAPGAGAFDDGPPGFWAPDGCALGGADGPTRPGTGRPGASPGVGAGGTGPWPPLRCTGAPGRRVVVDGAFVTGAIGAGRGGTGCRPSPPGARRRPGPVAAGRYVCGPRS